MDWTIAYRGLVEMAKMWWNLDESAPTAVLVELMDAIDQGKIGEELVRVIRNTFRYEARIGWNEELGEDPDMLDGIMAGFDHYHGGAINLEELAISEMMDAFDAGDLERAKTIQEALWEWETTLHEFVPVPISVYGVHPETLVEDSIVRAYNKDLTPEEWTAWMPLESDDLVGVALEASASNAGYAEEGYPDLLHQALSAQSWEKQERVPVYMESEYPFDIDEVYAALRKTNSDRVKFITEFADDIERQVITGKESYEFYKKVIDRARLAIAGFARQQLPEEIKNLSPTELAVYCTIIADRKSIPLTQRGLVVESLADGLELNPDDDDVYHHLYDRYRPDEFGEIETGKEDVDKLIRMISLPPEHPQFKPQHSEWFIRASGSLTSRARLNTCFSAGWKAYNKAKALKKSYSRRNYLGKMVVRAVDDDGVSGSGYKISWGEAAELARFGLLHSSKNGKSALLEAMHDIPAAQSVLGVIQ